MEEKKLSHEITTVFEYMKNVVCKKKHNTTIIHEYAYLLAILEKEDSMAYQALSSILMTSTLQKMREHFGAKLDDIKNNVSEETETPYSIFDKYFIECVEECNRLGTERVTSSILLLSMLRENEVILNEMKTFSVTLPQLINAVKKQVTEIMSTALVEIPKHYIKKKETKKIEMQQPVKIVSVSPTSENNIGHYTTNYTKKSLMGEVPTVVKYDKYYDEIFTILSKKNRNNVVVCGKSGVGKTATVKNIANIINKKQCNKSFHNKVLVGIDFSKLVVGSALKGAFEQKFYSIVNEAKQSGNYIFFIDNLQFLLDGNVKYAETDMETLLETLFVDPSIETICTATEGSFSKIQKNTILGKYLQSVVIEEPSEETAFDILNEVKSQYEKYHDVSFNDETVGECVSLCKKYITDRALPDSALDLMDLVGAKMALSIKENIVIGELKERLSNICNKINECKKSSDFKQYDEIDALTKEQISLKSKIGIAEKEEILTREPLHITKNDVRSVLSEKIDIPLEDITLSEKDRLQGLFDKISKKVIGQEEAVSEVCRAVKRQRVGLGDKNRPAVLMFLGTTGTGKTYLAKQLAKEVFGDEKYFVRMDMSEYADKTSINKISGSNPGYIGYDNDTFLVKALKRKKRFVLLLDEFEKSDDGVHDIFLQMFDEGRFTDNHGDEYSLKDVIIILTSNVGVTEVANRGKSIGFTKNDNNFSRDIIEKELKKKFKPEFLNRIQKIIFFNKLKDEDLRDIIKLEIKKLDNKIENLGYHLAEDITVTKMVDDIYNEILSHKEWGARPIVNEVQRRIEDKIVDYLIDNEVENNHTFTYEQLLSLD